MGEQLRPSTRGGRRSGGRAGNQRRDAGGSLPQSPWRIPEHHGGFVEPLSECQLDAALNAAFRVLEEVGLEFMSEEARRILKGAGARVDNSTHRVRIGRDIVKAAMCTAPRRFTITPRNPEREIPMSPEHLVFAPVASTPNCADFEKGRRAGARADFRKFLKLAQSFNCLHTTGGYPVEPIDLHPSVRHLHALGDMLTMTDKAIHAYSLGAEMIDDAMEMTRLAAGLSEDAFRAKPRMYTNINTNSPLKVDIPMMEGPLRLARRGQATIITPFTLAGAMAPVTIAGAVAQQTAEFLGVAAVLQLDSPGAAVAMGGFVSNVDMRSGAPAFGTPEYMRGAQIGGQMARRLGVPFRASNVNASNAVDAQAIWESGFSLWGAITGGANYLLHSAGWLEGGLVASFEKMVIDCEMLQNVAYYLQPLDLSEDAFGIEAMAEVGPGGHFFGAAHTQARYETAFYSPFLSDWRNYQSWAEAGAETAQDRARKLATQIVADAPLPPFDDSARGALEEFVAKRVQEGGVKTDF